MPKCWFQGPPEHYFNGKGLYCPEHQPKISGIRKILSQIQALDYSTAMAGMGETELTNFFQALVVLAAGELKEAGEFVVPGLGKLAKSERKARIGRNPQTGEAIALPEKTTVKFRVRKSVKDAVIAGKM